MRLFALASASARLTRWATLSVALATLSCATARTQDNQSDPPDQAGRVSTTSGTVSIQPAGSDDWGQAYPNLPIGPGDRIFTDQDGRIELQVGQTYLRIGPNTDITLVDNDAQNLNFGVAQGSVHIRSFGLWQGQTLNVSTPNGNTQLSTAGELRIDALPDQNATIFSSLNNGLVITGAAGYWQQMGNFQSLEIAGTNPVYPQWLQPAAADSLDQWSRQRDQQILNAASYRYVNPEMPGAAELDASGEWMPDSDYGPMWFPRNVSADWQPYHNGHWINRDPWGWVWVEDEPWGYAPFHYGRWVVYRGRWGWVPGPREQRPVWSPALVVFAGGGNVGGVGVSAWFPLGPGEAYRPWYRCSPRYIDRVNISNIHESRVIHVQNTYVNIVNVHNVTYVNRTVGVSAMRPNDFAAGRPVRQAGVRVDGRQFDHVQVIDRPAPVTRQSFVARPVGRPVPVGESHPVFINQRGMQITAKPGAQPIQPPVRQAPPPRPVQGRTVVAAPQEPGRLHNQPPPAQGGNQQQAPFSGAHPVGRPAQPIDRSPLHQAPVQAPAQAPVQNQNQNRPPAQNQNPNQPPAQNPNQNRPPAQSQNPNQQPGAPVRPVGRPAQPQDGTPRQFQQPGANPNAGQNPNQNRPQQPPVNNAPKPQPTPPQQQRPNQQPNRPQDATPVQPPAAPRPSPQPNPQQQSQPVRPQPQARPQDQARPNPSAKPNPAKPNKDDKKDQKPKQDEKKNDK